MAGGIGTKDIAKRWPVTSGTGADEKHEGRVIRLIAQKGSLVSQIKKAHLDGR